MKEEVLTKNLKNLFDKKITRKFTDMKDSYKNSINIKNNPIIYEVFIKDFDKFETGLTKINPGQINKEYFMTKGHMHKKSSEEIYILISGKGKLLIQEKSPKILTLKKNNHYIIPGNAGHRLINTGNNPLEVYTIYNKNAGKDYNFKFTKKLFKK
ncbi:MAG: cupin domain-containing protein [Nanoarchaeota archaeon]|nr:cupin domain-containing protein [Nanoarchaeota archaeon]